MARDTDTNVVILNEFKPSTMESTTASKRALNVVSSIAKYSLNHPLDEVQLTQQGVEPEALDSLKMLGVSNSELSWIVKPRTLAHRKSKHETLTKEETGRWLRAAKIQALAIEVFANKDKAVSWLHKPLRCFGGHKGIELVQTEAGAQLVEDTLNQIDAGYFA